MVQSLRGGSRKLLFRFSWFIATLSFSTLQQCFPTIKLFIDSYSTPEGGHYDHEAYFRLDKWMFLLREAFKSTQRFLLSSHICQAESGCFECFWCFKNSRVKNFFSFDSVFFRDAFDGMQMKLLIWWNVHTAWIRSALKLCSTRWLSRERCSSSRHLL